MQIPLRITTAQEMRDLDHIAEQEYQISPRILMENAGRAAVQVLFEYFPSAGTESEVLVFAGKGNNAGDAFVVARRLLCLDRKVRLFCLVDPEQFNDHTRRNYEILEQLKVKITHLERADDLEDFFRSSPGSYIAIDGILGTGLRGDLHGIYYDIVDVINRNVDDVIALDIPTGVCGDTGQVLGNSIEASLTVSFGFPKLGHFLPPGAGRRGTLVNVDISLPPRYRKEGDKYLLMRDPIARLLKKRDRYGHKNMFGHTLLVGGSPGKLGAIVMAARACHKVGTGLVTVSSWDHSLQPLMARLPDETMAAPLSIEGDKVEKYKKKLSEFSSLVVGPGLGTKPEAEEMIRVYFSSYRGPVVFDADALNVIADAKMHDLLIHRGAPTILTPHPGEMARLLDKPKEKVLADPLQAVKELVDLTHATVVLKGAATVIGSPKEVFYLNHYPNDGMATAGTGDVLAGMIGGLAGQGFDPFEAATVGVYIHSLAGEFAAKEFGPRAMTARDIISSIGQGFMEMKKLSESGESFPVEGWAELL